MSNSRTSNILPAFLQPNTVRSSRAAIFDDDFSQNQHQLKSKQSNRPGFSRRNQDQDFEEEESDDEDDQQSKLILERLYGQLQGAIEIEDTEMTTLTPGADFKQRMDDESDTSEIDGDEQKQKDQEEDEGMEFRLFASDDTPTSIVLNAKELEIIYVHRERPPLDESLGSERMRQIAEAAIDAKTVLAQSQIPWARSFFEHKIIHIPFKQDTGTQKVRKSKRKREWEKKVKAGLIDQAAIDATTRNIKVSESWGPQYTIRHGLDRDTIIVPEKHSSKKEVYSSRGGRGGRGSARGGGSGRGRGRGGSMGATREGHAEKSDRQTGDSDNKKEASTDRSAKKESSTESAIKKPGKDKLKAKSESTAPTATPDATKKIPSISPEKRTADAESSTKTKSITSSSSSTLPRPPKKPKANNKPMSKLDNIMAILTGK